MRVAPKAKAQAMAITKAEIPIPRKIDEPDPLMASPLKRNSLSLIDCFGIASCSEYLIHHIRLQGKVMKKMPWIWSDAWLAYLAGNYCNLLFRKVFRRLMGSGQDCLRYSLRRCCLSSITDRSDPPSWNRPGANNGYSSPFLSLRIR